MPKITKIYTGQGDQGKTRLSSGQLVDKYAQRVTAYGTVDELNAHIGLALTMNLSDTLTADLLSIQNELFHLARSRGKVIGSCFRKRRRETLLENRKKAAPFTNLAPVGFGQLVQLTVPSVETAIGKRLKEILW